MESHPEKVTPPSGVVTQHPPPYMVTMAPCSARSHQLWSGPRVLKAKVFGAIQLAFGIFAVILTGCGIWMSVRRNDYEHDTLRSIAMLSPGFWVALVYIVSGALGISASVKRTRCPTVVGNVFAILAAIFASLHLVIAAIALAMARGRPYPRWYDYGVCGTPFMYDYDYNWEGDDIMYAGSGSGSGGGGWNGTASNLLYPPQDDEGEESRSHRGSHHDRHHDSHHDSHHDRHHDSGSRSSWDEDFYDSFQGDRMADYPTHEGDDHGHGLAIVGGLFLLTALVQLVISICLAVLCRRALASGRAVSDTKGAAPNAEKAPLSGPVVVATVMAMPEVKDVNPATKEAEAFGDYRWVDDAPRDFSSPPPAYRPGSAGLTPLGE